MALKATIYKADLQVADMDRHRYDSHALTIAQHPSESDERMMVRILAFALNADAQLQFTKGLSADDEPEIWLRNLTDDIELWIDLGQPDERRVKKACARSTQVIIYTYQSRSAEVWWKQHKNKLQQFNNLTICSVANASVTSLLGLAARTMRLQCNIQDGQVWFGDETALFELELTKLM